LLVELMKSYLEPEDHEGKAPKEVLPADTPDLKVPRALGSRASTVLLHVDWRVTDGDRQARFRADGDAETVLEALAKFEESLRER
jgi:hypothetical protein